MVSLAEEFQGYAASASEESDDNTFEGDFYAQAEITHLKNKEKPITPDCYNEKVCRYLFAEDLVSYVSFEFHGLNYAIKFKGHPELLYHPFNDVVKRAVRFIRWQINETNRLSFEILESLSKSYSPFYKIFVEAILNRYSMEGLETGMFLYYCVYFAELASKCYRPDFNEILDFAVYSIIDAFSMLNEETNGLNHFAESILATSTYCRFYSDYETSTIAQAEEVSDSQDEICKESCLKYSHKNRMEKSPIPLKESDVKNNEKGFVLNKDCFDSYFNLKSCAKINECHSSPQDQILKDFVQELTSVVSLEEMRFLEMFLDYENLEESAFQNDSENQNETISKILSLLNIEIGSLDFKPDKLISQIFSDEKVKTATQSGVTFDSECVQRENERDSGDSIKLPNTESNAFESICQSFSDLEVETAAQSRDTFDAGIAQQKRKSSDFCDSKAKNIKLLNTESRALELISQNPEEGNKDKNSNTQLTESFTEMLHKNVATYSNTGLDQNAILLDSQNQQAKMCLVIYKREGDLNEENLMVLKGDSLVFAEDLVKYISKEFYGISYPESMFKENRDLICNAFNETVKEVAHFIRSEIDTANRLVFDILASMKEHGKDCYRNYIAAILSHYMQDGMNSDVFLYYSLHFSELAAKFYSLDKPEVLYLAVYSILDAFCFLKDDWGEIDAAVEQILGFSKQIPVNQDKVVLVCSEHASKFEKECLDTIHNSLKEIQSLRTKFGEQVLLLKRVEENYQDLLKHANLILPKMSKTNNSNISEPNKNEAVAEVESQLDVENSNTFNHIGAAYLRNLRSEVCSLISLEATELLKQFLM